MTEFEKAMVEKFAHDVADREKRAKEAINNLNFGLARAVLEEPMPTLLLSGWTLEREKALPQ